MRKPSRHKTPSEGTIRIIGGEWRGRKLHFPATDGLRPTGDRVRETLFNWLAPHIAGARCLDAFAGSGALGLEALSRGAAHCHFLDPQREAIDALRHNLSMLNTDAASVIQASALDWLQRCNDVFDVIFLDPPFASDFYEPALRAIVERGLLSSEGFIYVESDRKRTLTCDPTFSVHRDKTAGHTRYQLWQLLH